ncbi:MAG: HEXXH motif-containing putative peptide modification protein [Bacteriovoracaceae bacterium]|nr:HEXXH motif-containing putative peptide modification protein [Bacteriovoracaceae bacterium]
MTFKKQNYSLLKSRLKSRYKTLLKTTLNEMAKLPASDISQWVFEHQDELKSYSNLHWHFLTQLQTFNFFNKQSPDLGKNDFGIEEETVFEKWNSSEFADQFLKRLNKGKTLGKASQETLKDYDKHLVTLAERHILKSDKLTSAFRFQSSLGEYKKGKNICRLLETTLHLEGKELRLMTHTMKEMKAFSERIEIALKVIKKHSPTSWERFAAFTDVIIPIKQPEFVSYSHQDLPGYSMINLYHRDFVDLMDDLLHENGHHHLNYYLNLGKLIDEPLDNIYYSPWRRTPRPLRGVFHAYFTFFWAFKLFADLAGARELDSIWYLFGPHEKEKIHWRVVEEFHMLNYTYKELKWAFKQGLIHKTAWELIQEQQKELNKFKKKIPLWEKKLKAHRKDLSDLKKTLKKAEDLYAKD